MSYIEHLGIMKFQPQTHQNVPPVKSWAGCAEIRLATPAGRMAAGTVDVPTACFQISVVKLPTCNQCNQGKTYNCQKVSPKSSGVLVRSRFGHCLEAFISDFFRFTGWFLFESYQILRFNWQATWTKRNTRPLFGEGLCVEKTAVSSHLLPLDWLVEHI